MAETEPAPAEETEPAGKSVAGRVLDIAGVVALGLLICIAVDIWTDGKVISRRLGRKGGGGEPE